MPKLRTLTARTERNQTITVVTNASKPHFYKTVANWQHECRDELDGRLFHYYLMESGINIIAFPKAFKLVFFVEEAERETSDTSDDPYYYAYQSKKHKVGNLFIATSGANDTEIIANIRDLISDYLVLEGKDDAYWQGVKTDDVVIELRTKKPKQ